MSANRYQDLKFYTRRNYAEDLVIIDGISRSGKFMLSHVVAAFQGIEFIQYPLLLENLPYLVRFGKLDLETCRIILQTDVDYAAYNMMVGRTLNTRRTDITSVFNSVDPATLLSRAAREDEPALVDEFLKNKRLPLFFCHEGMCNMRTILAIFPKAKVLHILRDPAAIAMSWYKKGYGKRWGNDPKIVAFAFETPHGVVPWFAVDITEEYCAANEMGRVVLGIAQIMKMARIEFENLTAEQKKQILFTSFEKFVSDPEPDLKRVEAFTGKSRHPKIQTILDRERLPRPYAPDSGDKPAAEAAPLLTEAHRALLASLRGEYKDYWLGFAR